MVQVNSGLYKRTVFLNVSSSREFCKHHAERGQTGPLTILYKTFNNQGLRGLLKRVVFV